MHAHTHKCLPRLHQVQGLGLRTKSQRLFLSPRKKSQSLFHCPKTNLRNCSSDQDNISETIPLSKYKSQRPFLRPRTNLRQMFLKQFAVSAKNGMAAFRKAHTCSALSFSSLLKAGLETVHDGDQHMTMPLREHPPVVPAVKQKYPLSEADRPVLAVYTPQPETDKTNTNYLGPKYTGITGVNARGS